MQIVGYRLVGPDGAVIREWGGTWGQCPGIPNPLILPNGDHVHCAEVNVDYSGYRLIPWEMDEPPAPALTRIPKDLIWRRATDDEAEQMEAALDQQPVRLRRIYDGATYISTTDELYGMLQTALVAMFGEARASELLEPTE